MKNSVLGKKRVEILKYGERERSTSKRNKYVCKKRDERKWVLWKVKLYQVRLENGCERTHAIKHGD